MEPRERQKLTDKVAQTVIGQDIIDHLTARAVISLLIEEGTPGAAGDLLQGVVPLSYPSTIRLHARITEAADPVFRTALGSYLRQRQWDHKTGPSYTWDVLIPDSSKENTVTDTDPVVETARVDTMTVTQWVEKALHERFAKGVTILKFDHGMRSAVSLTGFGDPEADDANWTPGSDIPMMIEMIFGNEQRFKVTIEELP